LNVLLAGVSTRAVAESAARAGFDVTAIDAFADVDQHPSVRALSLGRLFSPDAAARRARNMACEAVAYGSNFENHPDAIALLAEGRALWGNTPEVVRRVRNPKLVADTLRRRGLAAPGLSIPDRPVLDPSVESGFDWVVKPFASGGGLRVRRWRPGERVPRGCYLQEFVPGTPGSIVFVAARGRAVPIGLTRELVGEDAFGVSGYRYCGNLLSAAGEDDDVLRAAQRLAAAVSEEFGLVGVNGIDFVVRDGLPYAIEINPRWCASMELVERAYGVCVFGMHAAACRDGALPDFDLERARRGARTVGKAVVFARRPVTIPSASPGSRLGVVSASPGNRLGVVSALPGNRTPAWPANDLRDVPHPGTRIGAGAPVCTVFASGRDASTCRAELVRRAQLVYASIDDPRREETPG
jgi:uncharacterized protein